MSLTLDNVGSWWMMSKKGLQFVYLVELPGEGTGEIESKSVDVHLGHPIPQAIHDELQHPRMLHVQRVAAAGKIHVVAVVFREITGSSSRCRCRAY